MRIVLLAAAATLVAGAPLLAKKPVADPVAAATQKPLDCPAPADHAINTKGAGSNDRVLTEKEKACDEARMANNKHPDLKK